MLLTATWRCPFRRLLGDDVHATRLERAWLLARRPLMMAITP
jgi:hypothetical protein